MLQKWKTEGRPVARLLYLLPQSGPQGRHCMEEEEDRRGGRWKRRKMEVEEDVSGGPAESRVG